MARAGTSIHGLRWIGCQQTNARRPPPRSARRRFAKAAVGSAKNMTPKRENRRSKSSRPRCAVCASASTKLELVSPDALARVSARPSIGRDTSTPRTAPFGPTRCPSSMLVAPQPQPTSTTLSPGAASASASTRSPIGAIRRSRVCSRAAQLSPAPSFQYWICSALGPAKDGISISVTRPPLSAKPRGKATALPPDPKGGETDGERGSRGEHPPRALARSQRVSSIGA